MGRERHETCESGVIKRKRSVVEEGLKISHGGIVKKDRTESLQLVMLGVDG